jgi:hypothetical protein
MVSMATPISKRCSLPPSFFKPMDIDGVGSVQDPGLLRNSPIFATLSEAGVLFPYAQGPDCVVSLGTGGPRPDPGGPSMAGSRGLWKDGSLPRCGRAFLKTMEGNRDWQTVISFGEPKSSGKYHRVDVEYDAKSGGPPMLDAVSEMSSLRSKALEDPSISPVLDSIARCVLSSKFYFELHTNPRRIGEEYVGSGSIRCVLPADGEAFEVLMKRLHARSARLLVGEKHITEFEETSNLDRTGKFSVSVPVNVKLDAKATLSIFVQEGDTPPCHISGSPFSIEKLVEAQGLEAYFGRADHRKRNWDEGDTEPTQAKRRRSS